jgi:hypothetical protein
VFFCFLHIISLSKKVQNLLQLALKNNNSSSTNQTLLKKQKQSNFFSNPITTFITTTPATTITSCHTCCPPLTNNPNNLDPNENAQKKQISNCIWKEIYDFFEHYNDRSRSMFDIDARLLSVRSKIKFKIENIQSTSFGFIKSEMNREISGCIKSPIEYSMLYEKKPYIDQLCYLYWLVEDLINEIGFIESLYPSVEALKADQPAYADRAFESTIKTLILW